MILLGAILLANDPSPLSIDPFMDESAAAHAFEQQISCLGEQAFELRNDERPPKEVAADVERACETGAKELRTALADVYRRKPSLLPTGTTPEKAADAYLATMNGRIEFAIQAGRNH